MSLRPTNLNEQRDLALATVLRDLIQLEIQRLQPGYLPPRHDYLLELNRLSNILDIHFFGD